MKLKEPIKGQDLFAKLQKKLGVNNRSELQKILGHSNLHHYKDKYLSSAMITNLVAGSIAVAHKSASKSALEDAIRTVVEFFPVQKHRSTHGKKWELFDLRKNRYFRGLHGALTSADAKVGVYVFFDSRGQAVYVGKTTRGLWREMKSAFNRERSGVQSVYRVPHPTRKVAYKSSEEKKRPIKPQQVPLHELAHYFSAYEVNLDIVDTVEALLIRTSANDLLNVQMAKIKNKRKKSA